MPERDVTPRPDRIVATEREQRDIASREVGSSPVPVGIVANDVARVLRPCTGDQPGITIDMALCRARARGSVLQSDHHEKEIYRVIS